MIRFFQRLSRKKGFTLVELIIVLAIVAVLMGCIAAFSRPIQDMVRATAVSSDALNVNEILGDYIEGRLSFASQLNIVYAATSDPHAEYNKIAQELNNLSTLASDKGGGGMAGALVFKYVDKYPDGKTMEKEQAGYRLYDVAITGTTYSAPTEDDAVFTSDFYGDTQRMILTPLAFNSADVRQVDFMTVEIYSYKGNADYADAGVYIKNNTVGGVYDFKKDNTKPDVLKELGVLRTGPLESVTFRLNNISLNKNACYIKSAVERGVPDGSDILVFYYVPKFAIT